MKRFLAFVLIAVLGVLTIGCESEKGTTQNKTQTKTTQTKDGKTTAGDDHDDRHHENYPPGYCRRWCQDD